MSVYFWVTGILTYLTAGFFLAVFLAKDVLREEIPPLAACMLFWPLFVLIDGTRSIWERVEKLYESFLDDEPQQPEANS